MGRSPPAGLRSNVLALAGRRLVVLSHPVVGEAAEHWTGRLTAGEVAVARALEQGHSYARIAELRGSSLGTVKKQVSSLYRRLGVRSRTELVVRLHT